MRNARPLRIAIARVAAIALLTATRPAPGGEPFAGFELPDAWEARFWGEPGVKTLLALDPKSLAELVPAQAGFRYCRCPSCEAPEADEPLAWSIEHADRLTCRRCGAHFPNDKVPAKVDGKVPEEAVEVLPHVFHHYPYHAVDAEHQLIGDERIYLAARRDYEAREFLARAALYAAIRHRDQPAGAKDPALARLSCLLILRFAQVYPAYAAHYDQPNEPKFFQPADLPPPYRRGYRTAKWDWSGCLDVPMNLAIAYALLRDDPALAEAGRLLNDPHPASTIERDLFRASAAFVLRQPEEYQEQSLFAYRGLLAVGRLLKDEALLREAEARLAGFAERAFTHDGLWRGADPAAHRRVLAQLDGGIARLRPEHPGALATFALARRAGAVPLGDPRSPEVVLTSWPAPRALPDKDRGPALLGGAGLARLSVGGGADALDLEMRGFGDVGAPHSPRLALRLAVGGRMVLGDLDDLPPTTGGFEHATASHNAVIVDGLNQREVPRLAREPAAGADEFFFAADPDFQVATMDDPRAYPRSATRYRQTLIASAGPTSRYAVAIFEVRGGLQHDQLFHAAAGTPARWRPSFPTATGPETLLPPSIPHLSAARAEDGRWFVQAMGEFSRLRGGPIDRPATADLRAAGAPGIRLHLLTDAPLTAFVGVTPDPSAPTGADDPGRSALVLRRRSGDGATLSTRFVTLFEPIGDGPPLRRVGRVASPDGTAVLALETPDGPEHLVVNLAPGTRRTVVLADGRTLTTDGLAVRANRFGLTLAGGTSARLGEQQVQIARSSGTIRGAIRRPTAEGRGVFETDAPLPDPEALAGRTLLIRHGDGTIRGWTLARVENPPTGAGGARLVVREEPGFLLSPITNAAEYYQFPRSTVPGPHTFRINRIARSR